MKRLLAVILCLALLGGVSAGAVGTEEELWSRTEPGGKYVTVRLPYPEGEELTWAESRNLAVRYADTKKPVPLSSDLKWGEWLFATVPAEDVERPLEVFLGEPARFADCIKVWQDYEYDEAPSGTDELNLRGIILGDGVNLNPDAVITRAEAFTIICRLLSLQPAGDPGFADVAEADWFYETASAAKAAGITNEPTYFRPTDPVSRGEFTVMLYRAMLSVGWMGETEEDADFWLNQLVDAGGIPDWARDAYLAFVPQGMGFFTYRETGEVDGEGMPIYEGFADHSAGATRGEVIELVYNALRWLPVYPSEAAIAYGFDKEMPVIDGSTSTLPYTNTVYAALFDNFDKHPLYPERHSKSYYSYERLINGETDILFISTKPTEDTLAKAEAAGVELELIPIAYDAMVFFTNSENSVENLTMEQIRNIYVNNPYTNWNELGGPDAGFIPYCRNADSGSQAQMEEFFLQGDEIHPDIKRETTSTTMASVLTDVQDAMTTDPLAYALGYSIYYYYQSSRYILLYPSDSLKLLSIDGVYPTDETIADSSYPLAGYNYAVVRADEPEDSIARRMVDFMLSEAGQICVSNAGFGPLAE